MFPGEGACGQQAQGIREIEAKQASLLQVSPECVVCQWASGSPKGLGESASTVSGLVSDGTSLGDTDQTADPLPCFRPPGPLRGLCWGWAPEGRNCPPRALGLHVCFGERLLPHPLPRGALAPTPLQFGVVSFFRSFMDFN